MNVNKVLEQLYFYNNHYEWINEQASKIKEKIAKLGKDKHEQREKLDKQLDELRSRYMSSEQQYDELLTCIRKYFKDKYDLDIDDVINRNE